MKFITLALLSITALFAEFKELSGKYTYLQARHLCKDTLGEPWRVPEIWELFVLRGQTDIFGRDKRYWSGNTLGEARIVNEIRHENEFFVNDKEIPAFAFYLQDGDITPTPKWVKANVLCTNQKKEMQSDEGFERTKSGVRDSRNGLTWEAVGDKKRRKMKLNFEAAQEYCDGKSDGDLQWRLPTLDELYSIVNYNYVKPSVNKAIFGDMQRKYYWTDDTFTDDMAYVVGFAVGSVATSDMINESYFRCVGE